MPSSPRPELNPRCGISKPILGYPTTLLQKNQHTSAQDIQRECGMMGNEKSNFHNGDSIVIMTIVLFCFQL